ncbi:MAG: glycoside hydrolase family 37 [Clostridia bacterium]|nr:glycoside hydrolase family 37 [Clostridia bacterium]
MKSIQDYSRMIKDYSAEAYKKLMRPSMGKLKHPFIVPGAVYAYQLWDWDSWLTDIAVRQILLDKGEISPEYLACERGCILNFLDSADGEGRIPIVIDEEAPEERGSGGAKFFDTWRNIHKPCLAQHLAFILRTDGDVTWFADRMDRLDAFIDYYRRTSYHAPTGLYYFLDDGAIGVDNDPAIFYRPEASTASIYLNALMYKELGAMSYIHTSLGNAEKAAEYHREAEALAAAINEHLYDERCGMYYSADINLLPVDPSAWLHSGAPRHWDSLIMRIDSWSGFLALWAGIAPPDRAKRVIEENMLSEMTFKGEWGIRSLSRLEKMYANLTTGNPSCWLGPVWGITMYMCFRALVNYGYDAEARELAALTVRLFGRDIDECGQMHEYYHPDTGVGLNNQGFQSWNLLVNNMIAYLEGREAVREF